MRAGSSHPDGRITLRNWDSSNFPASIDFGAVEVAVETDKELRDLWRFLRSRVCTGKDAPIVLLRMLRTMINLEKVETSRATFGPRDKIVLFNSASGIEPCMLDPFGNYSAFLSPCKEIPCKMMRDNFRIISLLIARKSV